GWDLLRVHRGYLLELIVGGESPMSGGSVRSGFSSSSIDCPSAEEPRTLPRRRDCSFEIHLCAKTLEIAVNDGDCQFLACKPIGQRAVTRLELPVNLDLVPALRMPDVGNAEVVLFGPEEWDGVEPLTPAENVARGRLSLTFGHDEVLDADALIR